MTPPVWRTAPPALDKLLGGVPRRRRRRRLCSTLPSWLQPGPRLPLTAKPPPVALRRLPAWPLALPLPLGAARRLRSRCAMRHRRSCAAALAAAHAVAGAPPPANARVPPPPCAHGRQRALPSRAQVEVVCEGAPPGALPPGAVAVPVSHTFRTDRAAGGAARLLHFAASERGCATARGVVSVVLRPPPTAATELCREHGSAPRLRGAQRATRKQPRSISWRRRGAWRGRDRAAGDTRGRRCGK